MSETNSCAAREVHGFRRTRCACILCQAACRHIPGSLDPSDLPNLWPPGQDVFVWAEQHLRALTDKPVPTLVPARQANGHCHWYYEGRCLVHEQAPYSCAFFDSHMTAAEIKRRSAATMRARRQDAGTEGLYLRLWRYLSQLGLSTASGDRAGLEKELHAIARNNPARFTRT